MEERYTSYKEPKASEIKARRRDEFEAMGKQIHKNILYGYIQSDTIEKYCGVLALYYFYGGKGMLKKRVCDDKVLEKLNIHGEKEITFYENKCYTYVFAGELYLYIRKYMDKRQATLLGVGWKELETVVNGINSFLRNNNIQLELNDRRHTIVVSTRNINDYDYKKQKEYRLEGWNTPLEFAVWLTRLCLNHYSGSVKKGLIFNKSIVNISDDFFANLEWHLNN